MTTDHAATTIACERAGSLRQRALAALLSRLTQDPEVPRERYLAAAQQHGDRALRERAWEAHAARKDQALQPSNAA